MSKQHMYIHTQDTNVLVYNITSVTMVIKLCAYFIWL